MKFLNVNSYRYGYQGEYAEDETEENGIKANSFQLRLYDPRLGRWMSPDPYGQYHSPYLAMGNTPNMSVDPDGGFDSRFGAWIYKMFNRTGGIIGGNREDGFHITTIGQDENGEYSLDLISGSNWERNGGMDLLLDAIKTGNGGFTFNGYLDKLDPRTLHQNLLGLTYPGGDNPKTFGGDYSYNYTPKDASELPAIGHDRRYDNLGVEGAKGLLLDRRAIGADWKFVGEELDIALRIYPPTPMKTRLKAATLGIGLGLASTPKTLYTLIIDSDISGKTLMQQYHLSNHGVTNKPSK